MYNNAPITVTTSRGGGKSENLKGQAVITDLKFGQNLRGN